MTDNDRPIDQLPPAPTETDEQDTEGHNLLAAELGRQVAREHAREAELFARDQANRHAVGKPRQSLRSRIFGNRG